MNDLMIRKVTTGGQDYVQVCATGAKDWSEFYFMVEDSPTALIEAMQFLDDCNAREAEMLQAVKLDKIQKMMGEFDKAYNAGLFEISRLILERIEEKAREAGTTATELFRARAFGNH